MLIVSKISIICYFVTTRRFCRKLSKVAPKLVVCSELLLASKLLLSSKLLLATKLLLASGLASKFLLTAVSIELLLRHGAELLLSVILLLPAGLLSLRHLLLLLCAMCSCTLQLSGFPMLLGNIIQ